MPMFVSAGSVSTQAMSPRASARRTPSRSLNSTTTVVSAGSTCGPDVAGLGDGLAVLADDRDGLVDRAVVAPVEDEHLGPALDLARDAQDEAVGVGRGQRELTSTAGRSAGAAPRRPRSSPPSASSSSRRRARRCGGRRRARSAPASARASSPCRRARSRRTRGRRRRRCARRAPPRRRADSRRPTSPSRASARRRSALRAPARRARASAACARGRARARARSAPPGACAR